MATLYAPLLVRYVSATGILVHLLLASMFIGTITLAVVAEAIYAYGKDARWLDTAKMFGRVAGIFLGTGAAFGTLVEFGLVTIWSNFVSIMGSALVLPFYIELYAFLFEVIFIVFYEFTWNKLNRGIHLLIGALAAFGAYFSAYNILAVMSSLSMAPPGLVIKQANIGGLITYVATFESPSQVFNVYWWGAQVFIWHGMLAATILSWSIVASIYIYKYMHSRDPHYLSILRVVIPTIAVLTAIEGFILGHDQGELVMNGDPLKLAAMEGMFWSGLKIDPLLSFFAFGTTNHAFWGYYTWPAYMRPPAFLPFFYLVLMVGLGAAIGGWAAITGLYLLLRREPPTWWFKLGYALGPVAGLASIGGAVTSETGRNPFILVQNLGGNPPTITGVPVSAIYNPTISVSPLLATAILLVILAIPGLTAYMLYLATKPRARGGEP